MPTGKVRMMQGRHDTAAVRRGLPRATGAVCMSPAVQGTERIQSPTNVGKVHDSVHMWATVMAVLSAVP